MLIPLILGGVAIYALATSKKPAQQSGQATTFSGASGTPWAVAPTRSGGGVVVYGVYLLPNGTPVMEYSQTNGDPGTNAFLSSPFPGNDPTLIKAMSDFGVKSQGGLVNQAPKTAGW